MTVLVTVEQHSSNSLTPLQITILGKNIFKNNPKANESNKEQLEIGNLTS